MSLGKGEERSPESQKTRSRRPVLATYKECPDNSLVEYAERDPYEGLVEEIDFPRRTL